MLLERVEIVGFRGINRLSLQLEQNNVLIGENAWGKSSLLDALTLLLSPEDQLYHFVHDDFWFPPGEKHWHGAAPTTAMSHIAIQERLDGKAVDWMEHVTDAQYGG